MICLSEQDLSYFYNKLAKLRNFKEIFYLENREWVTSAYLYARYEGLIDRSLLQEHLQGDFKIASDDSTFLHAIVLFTKQINTNDLQLLALATRSDTCGRTSIYYTARENHIDVLMPYIKNQEEFEDIVDYKIEARNYVGLDNYFIKNFTFNKILQCARKNNLTRMLEKLIPHCPTNDDKDRIYLELAMQYPIPWHPLSKKWFDKLPFATSEFVNWLQGKYSVNEVKYYEILLWILKTMDDPRTEDAIKLHNDCYVELMRQIKIGVVDLPYRTSKIMAKNAPTFVKNLHLENPEITRQICDTLTDGQFINAFHGSDGLYINAWFLFIMKCKTHDPKSTKIIESTFRRILHMHLYKENNLMHAVCMYEFSFEGFNNKDFWQWCKDAATARILDTINADGLTPEDLATMSPYLQND